MEQNNTVKNVDLSKVEFPPVLETGELIRKTNELVSPILFSAKSNEIADIGHYRKQAAEISRAASGDIRECSNIASSIFLKSDKFPELFNPYMAYQWYATAMCLTNDENWTTFSGMPGHSFQGVVDMFYQYMSFAVFVFGTYEQKYKSQLILKSYIEKYLGERYLYGADKTLYALLGMNPYSNNPDILVPDAPVHTELAIELYKKLIDYDTVSNNLADAQYLSYKFEKLLNLEYYKEKQEIKEEASSSSGGCYIATCVYGSYDCPQVWALRRYRDNYLAQSPIGKLFIKCYYAISPFMIKVFGDNFIRTLWKNFLDKKVQKLHSNGYSDAPYNDK